MKTARSLSLILLTLVICLDCFVPRNDLSQIMNAHAQTSLDALLSTQADWTTDGKDDGVEYGIAVSAAGDINRDGFGDIVVGSRKYLVGGERCGAAFIFTGSRNGLSATPHAELSPAVKGAYFGGAVSAAGDVNGDGYDDVLVGAPHYHVSSGYEGAAFVYYGSPAGIVLTPAWTRIGLEGDGEFGSSVSAAGDVNGDGYADVLIGSARYTEGQSNEGAAFLFLGSESGLASEPAWSYQSDQSGAQLGLDVAGLGDLNKDGYADIAVSAPNYDLQDGSDHGLVLVFYGAANSMDILPDWQAGGNQPDALFGSALASAGDVDHNSYPDLIIGARGVDVIDPLGETMADAGAAYLFYTTPTGVSPSAGWSMFGNQQYSGYGAAVAGIGDADQDGFSDVGIGAPRQTDDQSEEGFVYVYRGTPQGAALSPNWTSSGDKAETAFGAALGDAGDVNADGYSDLVVGAPIYKRDEKTVMGQAYVFHGASSTETQLINIFLPLILVNQQ